MAFVSDITGILQLWQVPVEGGWPEQLTFTDDRVMLGLYGHKHPTIVFGMDRGGDEQQQIFVLRSGALTEIDVDPAVMHAIGAISPDDRQVAFSSNRRHPAYFDVYVADLDGSNVRRVYEHDGSNFVSDWSPDGRYLLIIRRNGSLDLDPVLLDLRSGEATLLMPHEPPVAFATASSPPMGRLSSSPLMLAVSLRAPHVCACSDRQLEWLSDDDADVDLARLSPDGTLLAMIRNHDGYGKLSILDLEHGSETTGPDLPDGVAMEPAWSSDSRHLAFTLHLTHP